VVGGDFTEIDGITRNRIARLERDGTLDTSFDPGQGADGEVRSVLIQPDGKILIGGSFRNIGAVERHGIARLNEDGSPDLQFTPRRYEPYEIYALALEPNGKILVGGSWITPIGYMSSARTMVTRLHSDGTPDPSFWLVLPTAASDQWRDLPNPRCDCLALLPSGKILVGGVFGAVVGVPREGIARLQSDGRLDLEFDLALSDFEANSFSVQDDGKIVVARYGAVIPSLFRLNAEANAPFRITSWARETDGSLNMLLNPPLNQQVIIETSDNLVQWRVLSTNTVFNGTLQCEDESATQQPIRYYRVLVR
jgi:uncharacterized delta-60 repeat protein